MKTNDDPHSVRLMGKATYKGRPYYCGFHSRDGTRLPLFTLPDADGAYLAFWVDAAAVRIDKRYAVRQPRWNGVYGRRSRQLQQFTTLASIAEFIREQRANAGTAAERVQCIECDAWHDAGEPCPECGGC